MGTTNIRQKLHQFIDTLADNKAEAIYVLFEEEIDTNLRRKKLILAERENYLQKSTNKSYNWEEVKEMAIHKEKRPWPTK